jgi:translation initiation factor IF-2
MKAIEIANQNHVSYEDILIICKDLGISCDDENAVIPEKDIFLIEKRIETIKNKRAKEALERMERRGDSADSKGKKIKLKRKVHVPREASAPKEKAGSDQPAEPAPDRKPERGKPEAATGPQKKPADERRDDRRGPPRERPAGSPQGARPGAKPAPGRDRPRSADQRPPRPGQGPDRRPGGAPPRKTEEGAPAASSQSEPFGSKDSASKRKKTFIKEKDKKTKKDREKPATEKEITLRRKKAQSMREKPEAVPPKYIEITESISVGDLAKKLNVKASEVIGKLMKLGMLATINQVIDAETAEILASEYGTEVKVVSLYEETVIRQEEVSLPEDIASRPPIVTVMGHVDHGKTKLLDSIREANVVDGEFGGITQHIGAYRVRVGDQVITFLDTPGHEAFTTMRARGASVTDIVILVVAADDGVMPQTIEAINHARAAGVPIIVAINKIDLPQANTDRVKNELTKYELIPEEWGGTTLFAEISAKQKLNIDKLLDLVLLQSEMLQLTANPRIRGRGRVIESKLDPGRGAVATILVQNGTLRVGDPYVVGIYSGKVRALFDDQGVPVSEAGPSTPVEILGISGVPSAGDPFEVVESEKYSKQISQKRHDLQRIEAAKKVRKVTLEDLNEMIREGEVQELCVIIKADVDGSVQALKEALEKLGTGEIRVKVIHDGTGGINESDVMLASASNAIIIGYHVRPSARVVDLAEREKVSIKFYNIIFEVTNDVKAAMEGMLSPEIREEVIGSGEVRQTFKISKVGTVAGSIMLSGRIERKSRVRLVREGIVVFDGELKSLKRFKDDASEVEAGQECGIMLQGFNDIKDGDTFEAYRILEIAKKLD